MPESKLVGAEEVAVGTKVYFPNSRHAQEVESIETEYVNDKIQITFRAGTASWVCSAKHPVRVAVDE